MRGSISGAEDHGVAVLHLFALCQHLSSYKHEEGPPGKVDTSQALRKSPSQGGSVLAQEKRAHICFIGYFHPSCAGFRDPRQMQQHLPRPNWEALMASIALVTEAEWENRALCPNICGQGADKRDRRTTQAHLQGSALLATLDLESNVFTQALQSVLHRRAQTLSLVGGHSEDDLHNQRVDLGLTQQADHVPILLATRVWDDALVRVAEVVARQTPARVDVVVVVEPRPERHHQGVALVVLKDYMATVQWPLKHNPKQVVVDAHPPADKEAFQELSGKGERVICGRDQRPCWPLWRREAQTWRSSAGLGRCVYGQLEVLQGVQGDIRQGTGGEAQLETLQARTS